MAEAQWLPFHIQLAFQISKLQTVHLNIFSMDLRSQITFLYIKALRRRYVPQKRANHFIRAGLISY